MNDIYHLIFYFIIYSIIGWVLESIYKTIWEKKPINSGFLYGPYCPIYGFGTLIMILVLGKLKFNIILVFLASFLILSIWEYIAGFLLEKIYHTKYWDYSRYKLNINGRVCLVNSIYWGILGVVFIYIAHPLIEMAISGLLMEAVIYLDIVIGLLIIVDIIVSSIKTLGINKKIDQIKELGEKLKNNITGDVKQINLQYNKLKMKLYRQFTRMKEAFPSMKSETISKFLNEKIDVKELKEKIKLLKKESK